ncbi:MAG: bile acid:sodium symporter family protein [Prevotellaceae bacterium]|nr:bile acid:sodium symporter family protein [Prevotellaceae bacterium]
MSSIYESLNALNSVSPIKFAGTASLGVNIVLGIIMFGVALDINLKHFKELLKSPKPLIVGVLCQQVLLPALTFCIVVLGKNIITPQVAMGMILVAACPGGNISNFMAQLAKGRTELSIALTAITTVLATFTTPFNFAFWGRMYLNFLGKRSGEGMLQALEIDPVQMFITVFILLGIPLVIGLLFARKFPNVSKKIAKPLRQLSIGFFVLIVAGALANNFGLFIRHIHYIALIVFVHNGFALLVGYLGARFVAKLNEPEYRAITIETGIHNSGLGLALLFNPKIFPAPMVGMQFVTAWWGIWHIVSGLALAIYWSYKELKGEGTPKTAKVNRIK